ncbi:hypothetical protein ACFL0G_06030, partial [Candidatus Zixiibacteriota bacterium]
APGLKALPDGRGETLLHPCPRAAWAEEPAVVHITVFTSSDCPQCKHVKEQIIPDLERQFGSSLAVHYLDVDEGIYYDQLEALERQVGDTDNELPVIFCGEYVLGGRDEVEEGLATAIRQCLQAGGAVSIELFAEGEQGIRSADETIHLAYFHQVGCQKCSRVERMLAALERRWPNLTVGRFDLSLSENKTLAEAIGRLCRVPEDRRLVVPSVFIGRDALVGGEIRQAPLNGLLEKYTTTGVEPIWEAAAADTAQAVQGIIRRFRGLGVLTVMVAGLVDGVNPCAFATIIFLISYLAFVGRHRREVLLAGLAFTAAVLITYLAVGFGLFQFLHRLSFLNLVSQVIYLLAAILVIVLGAVSLYDYLQIRRGHRPAEMKLQLPLFLKRRIHDTIRRQSRSRHLVMGAFVTGAVVSVLELACTGQVYLPTIVFVMGVSGLKTHAFLYLLLYNLLFILPLVIVFLLSYAGVTSEQLATVLEAHLDRVKLALGLFFLLLGGFLILILVT